MRPLFLLLAAVAVGASFRTDARAPSGGDATDEFDADSPSWLDDAANESWPSLLAEDVPAERAGAVPDTASEVFTADPTWLPRTGGVGGGDAAAGEDNEVDSWEEWDADMWAPEEMSRLPVPSGAMAGDVPQPYPSPVEFDVPELLIAEANRARMLQLTATRT